jgi:hypothetical protein
MNCDGCAKFLEEDDTYERILCKSCTDEVVTVRCASCHCKLNTKTFYTTVKNILVKAFGPTTEKRIRLAGFIALCIGAISCYSPILGIKLAVGFSFIPIVLTILVSIFILVGPGIYKLGHFINKFVEYGISDHDPNEDFKKWLLGVFAIIFPFFAKVLGALVIFLFKKIVG